MRGRRPASESHREGWWGPRRGTRASETRRSGIRGSENRVSGNRASGTRGSKNLRLASSLSEIPKNNGRRKVRMRDVDGRIQSNSKVKKTNKSLKPVHLYVLKVNCVLHLYWICECVKTQLNSLMHYFSDVLIIDQVFV